MTTASPAQPLQTSYLRGTMVLLAVALPRARTSPAVQASAWNQADSHTEVFEVNEKANVRLLNLKKLLILFAV